MNVPPADNFNSIVTTKCQDNALDLTISPHRLVRAMAPGSPISNALQRDVINQ
jgi:hypothetical protein